MGKDSAFKTYYANNPEFRERHRQNILQIIYCNACKCEYSLGNKARHLKTTKHKVNTKQYTQKNESFNDTLKRLVDEHTSANVIANFVRNKVDTQ